MRNSYAALAITLVSLAPACTGGSGDLPGSSGGTSSTSSSGSSEGGREIRASDFDQSCSVDEDCVAVYEGDICAACPCANAAIAKTASESFYGKRPIAQCPQPDVECDVCPAPAVSCAQGTCTINR